MNVDSNYNPPPEEFIHRIKNGEDSLREVLIQYYYNYILSIVSRMIGKPAESCDEFSIGLEAFQESIDKFDETKNVSFLYFAGLVINRRIIDYIRKNRKNYAEYPFTYFEANDNENFMEKYEEKNSSFFEDKFEIQEELIKFKQELKKFDITFEDLARLAPKHLDTKLLCISLAKRIVESNDLSEKLISSKKLPIVELLSLCGLNRRTIENHRKYIIALFLVLRSDMEIIKNYCSFLVKGVN